MTTVSLSTYSKCFLTCTLQHLHGELLSLENMNFSAKKTSIQQNMSLNSYCVSDCSELELLSSSTNVEAVIK